MAFLDPAVALTHPTIEALGEPAFLLAVDADETVRFVALNRAHEEQTGLRSADLAGLTPHEALPTRIADAVAANSARCVSGGTVCRYEEELDLATGPKYWRTTLSPLFSTPASADGGHGEIRQVVGILGLSVDITAQKAETRRLLEALERMRRDCDDAANAGGAIAESMRGPLSLILSLAEGPERPRPPSDAAARNAVAGADAQGEPPHRHDPTRALISKAAQDALAQIDALENVTVHVGGPSILRSLDFGHLVRDRTARVDPEAKLSITYPRISLRADRPLLENALDRCLELAVAASASFARLSVQPMALAVGHVRMQLTFDHEADAAPHPQGPNGSSTEALNALVRLMHRYGGAAKAASDPVHGETTIHLTLPGRIDYSGPAVIAGARSEGSTAPIPFERALSSLAGPREFGAPPSIIHTAQTDAQARARLRDRLGRTRRKGLKPTG